MDNIQLEIYETNSSIFDGNPEYFPNKIFFQIDWSANIGFGQLTFSYDTKTDKWDCDTECMSKEFCNAVLQKWLEGIYETKIS